LFEQFDEDVQERIQMFFEQSMEVIDRAFQLLNRRYNKESKSVPASSLRPPFESSAVLMVPDSPQSRSSSTDSLVKAMSYQRFRWSLTDKRRVEAILRDFSDYNSRVTEHIKLWTIASNVGLHLQHLQHLENDHDSRLLGFSIDAKLAMVADNAQSISTSLEIKHPDAYHILRQVNTFDNGMGIIDWNNRSMLVEYRSYNPKSPVPVDLDSRTKDLVNNLAALLHEDKGNFFRTPICEGWIRQASQNRVAFLFVVPEGVQPKLTTLLHALQSTGQSGTPQMPMPTLEQRFELAHKLSRSIAQLQLVKWVGAKMFTPWKDLIGLYRFTKASGAIIFYSFHGASYRLPTRMRQWTGPNRGSLGSHSVGQNSSFLTDMPIMTQIRMSIATLRGSNIRAIHSRSYMTYMPSGLFYWR
jgi:hypothetical protein